MKNQNLLSINLSNQIVPNEVVFFSADANYTQVHFCNGRRSVYAQTLKSIEGQLLMAGFFRTHKSYLVNLHFFKEVHWNKANPYLLLSNNYRAAISRRKRAKLRKELKAISGILLSSI